MYLKPSEIFYSQDSVSNTFDQRSSHAGKQIGDTLDDLCEGRCSVSRIPTITVVQSDGKWISHDNRRLWVFRHLERLGKCDEISVYVSSSIPMAKLTSFNGGKDITVRRNPGGYWHYKPSKRRETPKTFTQDRKVYDSSTPMPRTISPNRPLSNSSNHQSQRFGFIRDTSMTKKDTNDDILYGSQRADQRFDTINSTAPIVYHGMGTRTFQATTQNMSNLHTQRQDSSARTASHIKQTPNEQFKQLYGNSYSTVQSSSSYKSNTEPSLSKVDRHDSLPSNPLHPPTAKSLMPMTRTITPHRPLSNDSNHQSQRFGLGQDISMAKKDANDDVLYRSQRADQKLDTINSVAPTVYYGIVARSSQATKQNMSNIRPQKENTPVRTASDILTSNEQAKQSYGKSYSTVQSNSSYKSKTEPSPSKVDRHDSLSSNPLHSPTAKAVGSQQAQYGTSYRESLSVTNPQTKVDIEESEQNYSTSTGFFVGVMKLCVIL